MGGQGRVRAGRKLSVHKGQHGQRPRKGTSLEGLSHGKATEATRGRQRPGQAGPLARGKVGTSFYRLRGVSH